jgi:hypothetical protein
MEIASLKLAAATIVARNVSPNVGAALVEWTDSSRCLRLHYFVNATPSEQDAGDVELSMAELLAEFTDVLNAETSLTVGLPGHEHSGSVVFVRR